MGKYKQQHADAKRAEDTYPVCLRGDLNADWKVANRALERAQEELRSSTSKETASDISGLVERVRAIEDEMAQHTEQWRFRALAPHRFRALAAKHPPRTGEDGEVIAEDRIGLHRATFFPALLRASLIEPDDLDDEDWRWLLGPGEEEEDHADEDDGILNDRQIKDLFDVAWFLNRDQVSVPFSHAASLATRDSGSE
jgi:hypothetical protein